MAIGGEYFDEIGVVARVATGGPECPIKFGLDVGAIVVSCYCRGVVDHVPRTGARVRIVGHYRFVDGCGSVDVASVSAA